MFSIIQFVMINNCMKRIIKKYSTFNKTNRLNCWKNLYEQYTERHNIQNVINTNASISATELIRDQVFVSPCEHVGPASLIACINGYPIDISRIFESDSNPEFLEFSHPIAKEAFWRSTAFIVSGVIEECFGAQNYMHDVNQGGFYCDCFINNKSLSPDNFSIIEERFNSIVDNKSVFERLEIDLNTAKTLYYDNPYKLAYLESLGQGNENVIVYRCGDIVDICPSPLVRHAGQLKYLKLFGTGSVRNPLTDNENSLQRIYGISFPNKTLFENWDLNQKEAKKRDHRRIGLEQKLFFFHQYSTGSAFMLPHGTHICNKLIELIKEQYWQRGFEEVTTPDIFDCDMWKKSGHWDLYQENLFKISLPSHEIMSLKPMNCPAHCLIYSHEERSHRSLPLRLADFGTLHRNESSGSLSGLTRLRKFHQDDAHIFCRPDQVEDEIRSSLDFMQYIYNVLGFKYSLTLSTRPDKYLGEISMWDLAEQQLRGCLDQMDRKWTLNRGEGAFYGPKIDITITDAMNRDHQCATIQLDFQLPLRFDLKYTINKSDNSYGRPVIIHRAILGSVERLLAIMIESNCGKWPFWINPRQVLVVPVAGNFNDYAEKVRSIIRAKLFMCDANLDESISFNRKIRQGQLEQYSCILVVGEKEMNNGTVSLRPRDAKVQKLYSIEDFLDKLSLWKNLRTLRIEDDC